MEVQFSPETEEKLKELAARDGHVSVHRLVQDAVEGYLAEIAQTRDMLDRRYDQLQNGEVTPISVEQVETYFRDKREKRNATRRP
jgi:predicted DNA-binding protein